MKITTIGIDLAKNVLVRPESRLSLCFTGVNSGVRGPGSNGTVNRTWTPPMPSAQFMTTRR